MLLTRLRSMATFGSTISVQFAAFNHRVLGGVSTGALAVDTSTLDRLQEIRNLNRAIARAPVFGHGLGYVYQLPSGDDEFSTKYQPTYSHNFYLWWWVKAGAVGMVVFALFANISSSAAWLAVDTAKDPSAIAALPAMPVIAIPYAFARVRMFSKLFIVRFSASCIGPTKFPIFVTRSRVSVPSFVAIDFSLSL